jgi:hypothetical protein
MVWGSEDAANDNNKLAEFLSGSIMKRRNTMN